MPEESKKTVRYDVDGYDIVTNALKDLLNQYPGLLKGEKFKFSTLEEENGMAFYPVTGAVIATEKKSITGKINQLCNYPFFLVYRTSINSPNSKADIKEFLDSVGKWMERQTIVIDGEKHKLESYPVLTEERKIEEITRITPSYLDKAYDNNVQDWVISMSLKYRNIFRVTY